ncbi:MAG: hypothetical protein ACRDH6_08065 [Actinomycetota bacterium]
MRKLAPALLVAVTLIPALPANAAKPLEVMTDAAGDSGTAGTPAGEVGIPGVDEGGFDLVSATITKAGKNLEFTVVHSVMPPFGSMPEAFRFIWAFMVDGNEYRIIAKNVDVGKPDLAAMTGNERIGQIDTDGHFRLEGACVAEDAVVTQFVNCPPLAYPEGTFDPAGASFTVTIPLSAVKAKTGSVIEGSTGEGAGICGTAGGFHLCWSTHIAERSSTATLIDIATQTKAYKVPKK